MGNYNGILLIVWNFIIIFFWFYKRKDKNPTHEESVKVFEYYKYAYNILLLSLSCKNVDNIICHDHKNYQNKSNFKRYEPSMTKTSLVLN
jgi:hypothetical protein